MENLLPKYEIPVVVALPFTYNPAAPPPPIVVEAREYNPFVKPISVEVELAAREPNVGTAVKGYAKVVAEVR